LHYWLFWLAALAVAVDLVAHLPRTPPVWGWVLRALVAVLVGRLLTPTGLRLTTPWAPWALSVSVLLSWALLAEVAREGKDAVPALVAALGALAGGMVMLPARSALFSELALLLCAALAGPVLVALLWESDTGPAVAGAVAYLPGLMLLGRWGTESE